MGKNAAEIQHARLMVSTIEAALRSGVGVVSVSIDGQSTTWDRKQAYAELAYWRKRLAAIDGSRPRVARINLGGGP